uniref:Uncharacterized protein n=1 Tax=Arundo donax TaxID=35708 RepID=A0A0A8YFD4_ARUDO
MRVIIDLASQHQNSATFMEIKPKRVVEIYMLRWIYDHIRKDWVWNDDIRDRVR